MIEKFTYLENNMNQSVSFVFSMITGRIVPPRNREVLF